MAQLREEVALINRLQADLDQFCEDQRRGRKVTEGQRQAWLQRFDEVFQRHGLRPEEDERLIATHERFLKHFAPKPPSAEKQKKTPLAPR